MGAEIKALCVGKGKDKDGSMRYSFKLNEKLGRDFLFISFEKSDVRKNYFKENKFYTFYVTETTDKKSSPKKLRTLFDKEKLKGISERAGILRQIFNTDSVNGLLDLIIKNEIMIDYLGKSGIDLGHIQKEYENEIKNFYEAISNGNSLTKNKTKKQKIKK